MEESLWKLLIWITEKVIEVKTKYFYDEANFSEMRNYSIKLQKKICISEFNYLPVIYFSESQAIDFSLETPCSAVKEKSKATWKETAITELEL